MVEKNPNKYNKSSLMFFLCMGGGFLLAILIFGAKSDLYILDGFWNQQNVVNNQTNIIFGNESDEGNVTIIGFLTVTDGILISNGSLDENGTCTFLSSPDGSNVVEVCNNNSFHFVEDGVQYFLFDNTRGEFNVPINITAPVDAQYFTGDGGGLFNLSVNLSDLNLSGLNVSVWKKDPANNSNIFYSEGNVNISNRLDVDVLYGHNSTNLEGDFIFNSNNANFSRFIVGETSMKLFNFRTEIFLNISLVNLLFFPFADGNIDPFVNVQTGFPGVGNWMTVNSGFWCESNPCAQARGVSTREMRVDLDATNLEDLNIFFYPASRSLETGDNCTISINRNDGSGWTHLWSQDGGPNMPPTLYNFTLSSAWNNQSNISVRALLDAGNFNDRCYVDDVVFRGTETTIINGSVERYDTTITGITDDIFFKYNDSSELESPGHGSWQFSHPIKLPKSTSPAPPFTCISKYEGMIFYNESDDNFYGCSDLDWVQLNN